jgi:hypothetical protein
MKQTNIVVARGVKNTRRIDKNDQEPPPKQTNNNITNAKKNPEAFVLPIFSPDASGVRFTPEASTPCLFDSEKAQPKHRGQGEGGGAHLAPRREVSDKTR